MIVFHDPELLTRGYLLNRLGESGVKVLTRLPDSTDWMHNPTVCVISASGSGRRVGRVFEEVVLGVEVFAPTKRAAAELSAHVRAWLEEWPSRSGRVSGFADLTRPQDSTDPDTDYPSYWYSARLNFKADDENTDQG